MGSLGVCNGVIDTVNGRLRCSIEWEVVEYVPPFEVTMLQPETVAAFVGSGFFILTPLWVAMYGGRVLLTAIRS